MSNQLCRMRWMPGIVDRVERSVSPGVTIHYTCIRVIGTAVTEIARLDE